MVDETEFDSMDEDYESRKEDSLRDFNIRLLRNQQPLGQEFQQVLDDNYWDLLDDA